MSTTNNHLSAVGLGLALGITWSADVFLLGITAWLLDWGTGAVHVVGSLYIGYAPTFWGSVIGMIWAFADCFIGGMLIAWIYNLFTDRRNNHHA